MLGRLQIEGFALGNDADYDSVREMQRWLETRTK